MRHNAFAKIIAVLACASISAPAALFANGGGQTSGPVGAVNYLDQGIKWAPAARADFYTRDQGSTMIPLGWLKALRTVDGKPFLADSLARYGYLPNPDDDDGLPVGFTASGPTGNQMVGMTCAACHTRQITVDDKDYRVDGGPAIVDFQAFLREMTDAVGRALASDAAFADFAKSVIGPAAPPASVADLRQDVALWYLREGTLMDRALPTKVPWGLGRLDAVAMIFNRLTGLDLGPAPSYLIADNIQPADAPVRYPFIWNAPIQDKTQWPGFADNGNDLLGLSRNLGEVYGVFGTFRPKKEWWHLAGVNFLSDNSANFDGLNRLEGLVRKIGAPQWPWSIDAVLAQRGATVFTQDAPGGSCASCHAEKPGKVRFFNQQTWATPVLDVGTDSREYAILGREAQTGSLQGAWIPFLLPKIKPREKAFSILAVSVVGSIVQNYTTLKTPKLGATAMAAPQAVPMSLPTTPSQAELRGAFHIAEASAPTMQFAYESRVLKGIWAAAPYLHNGSVPTLADLLKPAAARPVTFSVGRYFDKASVGLAADQHGSSYSRTTTGCEARDSGNSRCGHDFGTTLPDADKRALLEYLKTL
ncbi:di-heme-cytochrome C peroxidase [Sphingomonas sp. RT2P30]|uniref:di-heme-cytochrome C peroxidase n=1 Tax=Parasphingomonas halimpatiens TaxID=3096162 RepID=UPI002FCC12BD